MYRQRWIGIISCFALFILVFISQKLHISSGYLESGPGTELGLLFFLIPGIIASLFSGQDQLVNPLLGALLATPVCLLVVRIVMTSERPFWQELAWIGSGVFWCAIGALGCLVFRAWWHHSR